MSNEKILIPCSWIIFWLHTLCIPFHSFNPNPTVRDTFWTLSIGGAITTMPVWTVSQTAVQRYISIKYVNLARRWALGKSSDWNEEGKKSWALLISRLPPLMFFRACRWLQIFPPFLAPTFFSRTGQSGDFHVLPALDLLATCFPALATGRCLPSLLTSYTFPGSCHKFKFFLRFATETSSAPSCNWLTIQSDIKCLALRLP